MGWNRASRNKWRTLVLGLGAVIALLWGAVDIVGVPPQNLAWLLFQALVAIGAGDRSRRHGRMAFYTVCAGQGSGVGNLRPSRA